MHKKTILACDDHNLCEGADDSFELSRPARTGYYSERDYVSQEALLALGCTGAFSRNVAIEYLDKI